MISQKKIEFNINKPVNYMPITRKEKRRVTQVVMRHVLDVASRFDGTSKITINITARGNA